MGARFVLVLVERAKLTCAFSRAASSKLDPIYTGLAEAFLAQIMYTTRNSTGMFHLRLLLQ